MTGRRSTRCRAGRDRAATSSEMIYAVARERIRCDRIATLAVRGWLTSTLDGRSRARSTT
jgi:hypothetical protein